MSFMSESEGLLSRTWDQINSEDFARNKTTPWFPIDDYLIDKPYETTYIQLKQSCSAWRRITADFPGQEVPVVSQMDLKLG